MGISVKIVSNFLKFNRRLFVYFISSWHLVKYFCDQPGGLFECLWLQFDGSSYNPIPKY
jgi:hypothetical protein